MTKTLMPQNYCPDVTDHPAHSWNWTMLHPGRDSWQDDTSRCPGRYTPMLHRAPDPSPAVPVDPFAGLDD